MADGVREWLKERRAERVFLEAEEVTLAQRDALQKRLDLPLIGDNSLDGWLSAVRLSKTPGELRKPSGARP